MKNFYLTVWTVLAVFIAVMGFVTVMTLSRPSNSCKIDPAALPGRDIASLK